MIDPERTATSSVGPYWSDELQVLRARIVALGVRNLTHIKTQVLTKNGKNNFINPWVEIHTSTVGSPNGYGGRGQFYFAEQSRLNNQFKR